MLNTGDTAVMIVCGLALVAAMTVAQAQALSDPTRPPALLEGPAASEAGEHAPAAGLQSIIRSNCGKPGAIINGEFVTLGGRLGDARLMKVGEDFVTLKSPSGRETLKLIPGVEKKLVANGGGTPEKKGACVKGPGDEVKK